MHASSSYRPGPLIAAVGPSAVLVWIPGSGPTADDAWAGVASGADLAGMLPILAPHASWTALPDFALVLAEPDGLRVLVRGRWQVTVRTPGGDDPQPSGARAATWTESFVPGGLAVTILGPDAVADAPAAQYALVAGVVQVSALTWSPVGSATTGDGDPAAVPVPVAVPATVATPIPTPIAPRPADVPPPTPVPEQTLPPAAFASRPEPEPEEPPAPRDPAPALDGPEPLPAAPITSGAAADPASDDPSEAVTVDLPDPTPLDGTRADAGDIENSLSYDLLYGTAARPVRTEAASPVSEAPASPPPAVPPAASAPTLAPRPDAWPLESPSMPGPAPLDPPESPSPAEPDTSAGLLHAPPGVRTAPPSPRDDVASAGLITSPWRLRATPEEGGAALPRAGTGGLPPEATVRRPGTGPAPIPETPAAPPDGPTRARPSGPPPPGAVPDGPTVTAVLCSDGHANRVGARACRVCRGGIPRQDPAVAARPPLGTLRLRGVNAPDVVIDRPVVLGRRPRASGLVNGELPQLVTVPPPNDDVSRSHLQFELDGWDVSVSDLGSANGTILEAPGAAPLTLSPGVPVRLSAGSRLVLSDDIAIEVEVDG